MSDKKSNGAWRAKGYYIALILCAAAIGISGYVYYGSGTEVEPLADQPVAATDPVRTQPTVAPVQTRTTDATQATAPTGSKLAVCAPVEGSVAADYAMEVLSYNQTTRDWRVHNGVDIVAAPGSPVRAAADGEIYTVYEDGEMGMTVVIRHEGGYTTKYSSLSDPVSVSAGQTVTMGQAIGCVGTTALMESALGDHVHFSVTLNDEPLDPNEFLAQE